MFPTQKKATANAAAPAAAMAPAAGADASFGAPGGIATHIELHAGEKDNTNLAYIERLAHAWDVITDHHVFRDIQSANPLAINDSHDDCGTQHPFDLVSYKNALTAGNTYTAGINLFWIDLLWSSTPGVPLRISAIEQMASTMFKQPTVITDVHIATSGPDFNQIAQGGVDAGVARRDHRGRRVGHFEGHR